MVGIPPTDSGHHGMPPVPQTTRENGLSTGQIGSLILEMNAILRNEFYPVLGSRLTHRFDTICGTIRASCVRRQSLRLKTLPRQHANLQSPLSSHQQPDPMQQPHVPIQQTCLIPKSSRSPVPSPGRCESPGGTAQTPLRANSKTQLRLYHCLTRPSPNSPMAR